MLRLVKLHCGTFLDGNSKKSGNWLYHDQMLFTTIDISKSTCSEGTHCAFKHNKGGGWFKCCSRLNFNGIYRDKPDTDDNQNIKKHKSCHQIELNKHFFQRTVRELLVWPWNVEVLKIITIDALNAMMGAMIMLKSTKTERSHFFIHWMLKIKNFRKFLTYLTSSEVLI